MKINQTSQHYPVQINYSKCTRCGKCLKRAVLSLGYSDEKILNIPGGYELKIYRNQFK